MSTIATGTVGSNPLFSLEGKRALVTGGTSGIGLAIVEAMVSVGAQVVTCSDRPEDVTQFHCNGAQALDHKLSDRAAAYALVEKAEHTLGGAIDILVSNAGIEGPVGLTGTSDEDAYMRVFDVNLHSAYWLAAACKDGMREQGGGAIILMASLSAMRGNRMIGTYAMTKAALAQMARNLAVELGPQNIRANAIAPGLIATPFSKALMSDAAFLERRLQATPLRRVGRPEEVAAAAVFLASSGGAFTTGQTLVIDGGTLVNDGS